MPSQSDVDSPLVYVGHRLFDGRSAALNAKFQSIFAAEGGQIDTDACFPDGPEIKTLEDAGWARRHWSSDDLDTVCAEFFENGEAALDNPVLPYAACSGIDAASAHAGVALFAARLALRRYFDNKVAARQLFSSLHLPEPKWMAANPTDAAVARVGTNVGYPYVARAPFSNAGTSTFLVRCEDDARRLIERTGHERILKWLFEQYIPGLSLNVNAVASQRRIVVFVPSIQILGEATGRDTPFAFCGNDYAAAQELPRTVLLTVSSQTQVIARRMVEAGFRGIFGVDFVVDADGLSYPCEINPRFQHSTALLNCSLCDTPERSPVQRHLETFGPQSSTESDGLDPVPNALYSQVSVHSDASADAEATNGLSEGRYALDRGALRLLDNRCDPWRITPGSFLAVDTVRTAGTLIHQGASLARLIFRGSILNPVSLQLRASIPPIIESVRSELSLRPSLAQVSR